MRIENGRYTAGEFLPQWGLADGTRKRTFRDKINFHEPFESPPKIFIAISGFDIFDVGESFRASVDVQAERITTEGFTVQFNAYDTSGVRELTVDWLAVGV